MINNFTGVGRLTGNAELKYTSSGVACLKFSICINKSYMKGGEWVNKANFFNCVVWGKYAEAMQKHLTKGRQIGVIGELDYNAWTDGQGGKHHEITIVINSISLMAQPKNGGDIGGHENNPPEGEGGTEAPPDNIPF
jgi:single-strand DNA-binding protein